MTPARVLDDLTLNLHLQAALVKGSSIQQLSQLLSDTIVFMRVQSGMCTQKKNAEVSYQQSTVVGCHTSTLLASRSSRIRSSAYRQQHQP